MFTSVASLVFALAAALTIIRCDCFFFSLPDYHLRVNKPASSVIRRDAANVTPGSVQSSTRIRSTAGADSLGFSSTLTKAGYSLPTQVIFGSNSIEHGVNLIEEKTNSVILVSGWNSARLDPILWELEPRGFKLGICCVTEEPSFENVHEVLAAIMRSDCGAVIAMGCGSVIETAKLATMLINTHPDREHLAGLSAIELGDLIRSMKAGERQESVRGILLVSIPSLPSLGAELASVTAVRKEIQSYSKREVTKMYVRSMAPDLCLVQPSLTYRAPMALVHDRLLALLATSVDIILSDPGNVLYCSVLYCTARLDFYTAT
jgi:Iron-containing alcohol dehydrogenase